MNTLNSHDFHDSLNTSMYISISVFLSERYPAGFWYLGCGISSPKKNKNLLELKILGPSTPGLRVTLKWVILDTSDICIYMYAWCIYITYIHTYILTYIHTYIHTYKSKFRVLACCLYRSKWSVLKNFSRFRRKYLCRSLFPWSCVLWVSRVPILFRTTLFLSNGCFCLLLWF